MDYFTTLGVAFSCNYDLALRITWIKIVNKIKNRIPLIKGNFYTIFQKSIIVNSLILSKVWYTAHIYPLPMEFSKCIVTEIMNFIWKRNYNPISRNVLYNNKLNGGIAQVVQRYTKSKKICRRNGQ